MSPEQAEGKPADARSDVFSFGAVLYEMITGRRAFSGATRMSTLAAILDAEPPPPSQAIPGLSPDLEKLILRCLRKSPERRWQSMADLKVALEDMREELDARDTSRDTPYRLERPDGRPSSPSRPPSLQWRSAPGGWRRGHGRRPVPRPF